MDAESKASPAANNILGEIRSDTGHRKREGLQSKQLMPACQPHRKEVVHVRKDKTPHCFDLRKEMYDRTVRGECEASRQGDKEPFERNGEQRGGIE